MDVARPYTAICPTLDTEVLTLLAGTSRPLTGREVSRLIGRRSHSGVLDVLSRLSEHGLVDRQEAGQALLYTLNREHLAAPAVQLLANMRNTLVSRLGDLVTHWEIPPVQASIFGSAARGDGDTKSDIDLFIVRPKNVEEENFTWRQQIQDLADKVRRWTGNHASTAEVGQAEIRRLRREKPPIVADLVADSVVLTGPAVAEILRVA